MSELDFDLRSLDSLATTFDLDLDDLEVLDFQQNPQPHTNNLAKQYNTRYCNTNQPNQYGPEHDDFSVGQQDLLQPADLASEDKVISREELETRYNDVMNLLIEAGIDPDTLLTEEEEHEIIQNTRELQTNGPPEQLDMSSSLREEITARCPPEILDDDDLFEAAFAEISIQPKTVPRKSENKSRLSSLADLLEPEPQLYTIQAAKPPTTTPVTQPRKVTVTTCLKPQQMPRSSNTPPDPAGLTAGLQQPGPSTSQFRTFPQQQQQIHQPSQLQQQPSQLQQQLQPQLQQQPQPPRLQQQPQQQQFIGRGYPPQFTPGIPPGARGTPQFRGAQLGANPGRNPNQSPRFQTSQFQPAPGPQAAITNRTHSKSTPGFNSFQGQRGLPRTAPQLNTGQTAPQLNTGHFVRGDGLPRGGRGSQPQQRGLGTPPLNQGGQRQNQSLQPLSNSRGHQFQTNPAPAPQQGRGQQSPQHPYPGARGGQIQFQTNQSFPQNRGGIMYMQGHGQPSRTNQTIQRF